MLDQSCHTLDIEVFSEETVEKLLAEAYAVRINDLRKSIHLAGRAAELSRDIHPLWCARALNQLGLFHMIRGEFTKAISLAEQALEIFEPHHDIKGIADARYTIANAYYKTDNFHTGLQVLLDCLASYRQLNDHHNEARVLKSMGTIYEYFGDYQNATDSYLKCIEVAGRINDLNQVSNAYNPLSGIYLKEGKNELAFETIQKSIAIKEESKDRRGLAFALYGRGKVHLRLNAYAKAMEDLTQALHIHREMGDKTGEGLALNKLGLTCFRMKDYNEAEKYFYAASDLAGKLNIRYIVFKANYNLYLLANARGDTREALLRLQQYVKLKEAVINTRTYNIIKSYESIKKIEALEHEAQAQKDRNEIIEKKNDELDSFFYRISHDLKGPIASMLGLYNLVRLEIRDETALGYFDLYQSQLVRINNIVTDLINLTRMNHDGLGKARINFRMLVDDCILSYHYLANFRKIRFTKQIDEDIRFMSELPIVNTILQNLIENAIKYQRLDSEPYVGIFIRQADDHVEIRVEDNGQGIREQDLSRIFDMFFRANEGVQGTGLGLYILKRAVERLNGRVIVESEIDKGSQFKVLLPLTE